LLLDIKISDTGIGIPPEKLETIFAPFSQVLGDNKRKYGGFGIGLSVSKALVDLLDGEFYLNSTQNIGSNCNIKLKLELAETPPISNIFPIDIPDLLGKTILVMEDNLVNQMVLKLLLQKWKNTFVLFANNGAEGINMLCENDKIDIVLMDIQMPVMSGIEAVSKIRNGAAGAAYAHIPIIVVTADIRNSTYQTMADFGIDGYILKPVDSQLLYQKVISALSKTIQA
jgi:CheY-like chemotaxis protein